MIATLPPTHTHQPPHPLSSLPPSYSTVMSDEETTGLKSRFSVSTVGSPRPVSTGSYRDSHSYAPYPTPSSAASPHRVSVIASRKRQQHNERERKILSRQSILSHHDTRQFANQNRNSNSDCNCNTNTIPARESISISISARDSFVHFDSDSDSDPSSPSSPPSSPSPSLPSVYSVPSCESHNSRQSGSGSGSGSASGSGSGHSCPPTPNIGTKGLHMDVKVKGNDVTLKVDGSGRRGSADSDDVNAYSLRPSSFTLGIGLPTPASRTPSVYLPASSLPALADLPSDSTPASRTSFALPRNSETHPSASRASSLVIRTSRSGRGGRGSDDLRRLTVQDLREQDLTYLDDLDGVDNRPDEERIIALRLGRNSLLLAKRASVLSSASSASLYSQGTVKSFPGARKNDKEGEEKDGEEVRDVDPNRLSAITYATSRASVQTYGSSVLTYGSLASRPQSPTEDKEADTNADDTGRNEGTENRPAHPLPWDPRPSAVSRINRQRRGPRPLPPVPPKKGSSASASARMSSSANGGAKRKPRPLPRPPSQVPLEDISEVPAPAASDENKSSQQNEEQRTSTYLSSATDNSGSFRRGSRRRSRRYSALASAYGHPSRRGSTSSIAGNGETSVGVSRASSISIRTGGLSVSGCEVPDIDELVRILDEIDFRKNGRSQSEMAQKGSAKSRDADDREASTPTPTSPLSPDELNMGDALEDTRGCVAVPGGGIAQTRLTVPSIGLPTPAATPKPRTPPKVVEPLPHLITAVANLSIPPPPSVIAPKPVTSGSESAQASLLSPPDAQPNSNRSSALLCPTPSSSVLYSPASGVSAPSSHLSFPLPPDDFQIPGPSVVGAADVPVPAKDDGEVTPDTGVRLSFAEKATLPGLSMSVARTIVLGKREALSTPPPPPVPEKPSTRGSPGKHTSTQDAIADLRNRVSALARSLPIPTLPVPLNPKPSIATGMQMTRPRGASASEYLPGVPRLMLPVPPRRRATSSATPMNTAPIPPPVPEKENVRRIRDVKGKEKETRHPYAAALGLAKIDVDAANNYGVPKVPPSSFKVPATSEGSGPFSAPPVVALRFRNSRRGSELGIDMAHSSVAPFTATPGPMTGSSTIGIAPSSGRPSTANALTGYTTSTSATFLGSTTPASTAVSSTATTSRPATTDSTTTSSTIGPTSSPPKPSRTSSVCAPSPVLNIPPVAPLRFKNHRSSVVSRTKNSTVTSDSNTVSDPAAIPQEKSNVKPADMHVPTLLIPEETEEGYGTNVTTVSTEASLSERRARLKEELVNNEAIGPELARIIHSIADADPDSQMASLLTIASSINSEKQDFDFGGVPAQEASEDNDEDENEDDFNDSSEKKDRLSIVSLSGEKRRNKGRTTVRRRPSARSSRRTSRDNARRSATLLSVELKNLAPADPEALKALPDPNTFPIPESSLATRPSTVVDTAPEAGPFGDLSRMLKPSPLPKLKVITKFKGDTILLPSSQAPLSAVSTKSTMSTMSTMSGISALGNAVGLGSGLRGPRTMNRLTLTDPRSPMADAAAAAAALVERFKQKRVALTQRGPEGGVQRRHQRDGSKDGTGRARAPLTGSGFFGSSVRAFPDPVLRGATRKTRADRTSVEVEQYNDFLLE